MFDVNPAPVEAAQQEQSHAKTLEDAKKDAPLSLRLGVRSIFLKKNLNFPATKPAAAVFSHWKGGIIVRLKRLRGDRVTRSHN
jgi:hypothetical protein